MRSQVPKFGTEWFNVNRYSVVPDAIRYVPLKSTEFGTQPYLTAFPFSFPLTDNKPIQLAAPDPCTHTVRWAHAEWARPRTTCPPAAGLPSLITYHRPGDYSSCCSFSASAVDYYATENKYAELSRKTPRCLSGSTSSNYKAQTLWKLKKTKQD